jgi:hypothetical protein
MKATDVLAALSNKGAAMCKGYTKDGRTYWIHPTRAIVPTALAEQVIKLPGVKPCGDGLFADASQTWKLA